MEITAYKNSKSIKIDNYSAITIICALHVAEEAYRKDGYDKPANELVQIRNALREAYKEINPNTYKLK